MADIFKLSSLKSLNLGTNYITDEGAEFLPATSMI
jgi:hypothetical protein